MKRVYHYGVLILNYGCVTYFLGLPAFAIILGFSDMTFGKGTDIAKFLSDFHFAVTALVAAVAGLNSFDRYKANGNAKKEGCVRIFCVCRVLWEYCNGEIEKILIILRSNQLTIIPGNELYERYYFFWTR